MSKKTPFIELFNKKALANRHDTLSRDVIRQNEKLFNKLSSIRIRAKLSNERLAEIEKHLRRKFPSFHEATDYIFQQLEVSAFSPSKGIYFYPLLIDGPPGTGKTHYARELAELLGVGFEKIDLSATTAGMVIVGTSSQWGNSKPGLVASHLLQNPIANFVLFLDEIDKAEKRFSNGGDVNNSLLTLLEPESAREFQDEFVQVPMDASHICIIATANDVSMIAEPIMSRFKKVTVTEPTPEELKQIAPFAVENIIKHYEMENFISPNMSPAALHMLEFDKINVRQLNEVLRTAIGLCIKDKSTELSEIHISEAIELSRGGSKNLRTKPKSNKNLH